LSIDAVYRDEGEVDGEGHPEAEEDVGDEETGEEIWAGTGGDGKSGVEASAVGLVCRRNAVEEANAERVDAEEKSKHREGERDSGGPVVLSKDSHRRGSHPVHEGRLVEEADAVDVGGDVVVAVQHLAADLYVDGVDVVEETGFEDAS
jgi:hypothetical protein